MKCQRVKKLIPLAVGDDLRPRLGRAVRAHVEACPGCRKELEGYRRTLAQLKAAAKAEGVPDWNEGEWKGLMVRVAAGAGTGRAATDKARVRILRPHWAAASVLGVFLGLVVLGVLFRNPFLEPERTTDTGLSSIASRAPQQEKVAVTLVSQETGLQIVWFFDKNFEWKGDHE